LTDRILWAPWGDTPINPTAIKLLRSHPNIAYRRESEQLHSGRARRPPWRVGVRSLVTVSLLLVAGCVLPSLQGRATTVAIKDTAETPLGRDLAPRLQGHAGQSGIHPLPVAEDAFAARALLAAAAQKSIDVQYYIWHADVTGTLLFEALWRAAERGVRVRLLLDDNSTAGLDSKLAALAAHPNIQVRLFNPLAVRSPRWMNYVIDFRRVNHRMHNKSFTVDNQVTVVGGRNIGDEYFDAGSEVAFADLDVVAVGPVVDEVSSSFDLYWNSGAAYPAELMLGEASPQGAARLQDGFRAVRTSAAAAKYLQALQQSKLLGELLQGDLRLDWSEVRLVYDEPTKVRGEGSRDTLLLPRLLQSIGAPEAQVDLVSPYLVPMKEGTESFVQLVARGVKVRILTNSLESNDVAAVHAGYAKRRKRLLEGGVELYELRRSAVPAGRSQSGHSSAALHAKTFQVDDRRVFVGSFNFDPRSAKLNTEMGFVIASPALAGAIRSFFDKQVPQLAYKVRLSGGDIQWLDSSSASLKLYDSEPGSSAWRRASVKVLSLLPIDWLL
jgi:putative cardiolipin synthase